MRSRGWWWWHGGRFGRRRVSGGIGVEGEVGGGGVWVVGGGGDWDMRWF